MPAFERLSALDASFLDLEGPDTPMHLAATLVFERGPLAAEDDAIDMTRIRKAVTARLHQTPRLRRRLAYTRWTGHPAWVDDAHFQLDYHLRYLALPAPGSRGMLRDLVGQVLSQPLDRGKPLWEIWVVDGLADGRVAAICKMHHSLMDGMAGVGVMSVLLSPQRSSEVPAARPWSPQPAPRPELLLAADALRRIRGTGRLLGMGLDAVRHPLGALAGLGEGAASVYETLREGVTPASPTPLNRPLGPHRRVHWLAVELDAIKAIKKRLGGTVNDVVVAAVAGGLRRFFEGRDLDVDRLRCRAMFPVNVRRRGERGEAGNRLAVIGGRLPVDVASPRRRLETVVETTEALKHSRLAHGTEILNAVADWIHGSVVTEAQRLALLARSYNVIITNIRGPQVPLYMLDSPMLEVHPTLPLFRNQALSVAVFSYAGRIYWGLTADRAAVPDLDELGHALRSEIAALRKAAA